MEFEVNEKQKSKNIIYLIKVILMYIILLSIVFEIILFPSVENLFGCVMMIVSYVVFVNLFLKSSIIINFPFSFMMFLSMFMYRYLPLPITLLEGKPVSYGMEMPIKTFYLETILYIVSCLAFYFATRNNRENNILKRYLDRFGFYNKGNAVVFWIMGISGCIIRLITFSMGDIETGNVVGKLLLEMVNFIYVPVILFFPCFYKKDSAKKVNFKKAIVWIYILFISIINLAANSRNSIMIPFATIILLYILYLCVYNISLSKILKPANIIIAIILVVGVTKLLNVTSDAILSTRNIREDISFVELIEVTYSNIINSNSQSKIKDLSEPTSYSQGWTETYIDNDFLNRYANMRITDQTLYLGEILGNTRMSIMRKDFFNRVICILPQPVIDKIGLEINKNDYISSRGDALYVYSGLGKSYSWGGYRVTSHLGDGLATFGYLYFIFQYIMFFIIFKLLNSFSYYHKEEGIKYSIYGLLSLYTCLGMFRNANGIMGDVGFILRGYWEEIIIFIVVFNIARFISRLRI